MPAPFVHLSLHTEYSLQDSVVRHKGLIAEVAKHEMPAVAVTDVGNLYGLVRFYGAALNAGIKPIIGADLRMLDGEEKSRLLIYATNNAGYKRLTELVSKSFTDGQVMSVPYVQKQWLEGDNSGLLALSGGTEGEVGILIRNGRLEEAEQAASNLAELFPNRFYMQLHRTGWSAEDQYIAAAVPLAEKLNLPLVATNEVCFISEDQYEDHETRVCIQAGEILSDPKRPKRYTPQQYFRSPDEMAELFADIPQAVTNTVEIAKLCNVTLTLGENFLPDFPVPDGHTIASFLEFESEQGLKDRMIQHWEQEAVVDNIPSDEEKAKVEAEYAERLKIELGVINGMGFPGYFLIVADFIQWSKNNDIPVGPGRGSGAGSLVAYALKITDLDPLKYDLLFERFLNPERVSMPDFDVDFCMEGRDRVIDYVAQTYGRDKVSQIITFGSMAAKASIRDVGRVLGQPYGLVDRVAKMVPPDLGMTLTLALQENPELKALVDGEDEEVAPLYKKALALEGLSRNVGKHAGGVVISPSALTDFTPIYCDQDSDQFVSQFDKDDVESVGLVKFDFLGLRTLTIIDWAVKTINRNRAAANEDPLRMDLVPLTDPAAYKLLCTGKTTAVFQLESGGMQRLLTQLKPDNFEDIVALVALFRPGPLGSGMVEDFVARKHGAKIKYPHPSLEEILKPTYGVILYQEQVMQIAQVMGGYTLGGADILRRAMGKKKVEEMQRQLAIFVEGSVKNGVEADTAKYIFELIEKFAGYGFNKSHSAAYALLTYQTAWLKTHYPAEFMAAVMTADMENTAKIVSLIHDSEAMGLNILPPDINRSVYQFTAIGGKDLLYGMGAIKGVGFAAIDGVVKERDLNGEYSDIYDLCRRNDLQKTNRKTLQTLIEAGAMDKLGANRATLAAQLPKAMKAAEQAAADALAGQTDLFGLLEPADEPVVATFDSEVLEEWEERERLAYEKATLGLYLTGHPIFAYSDELPYLTGGKLSELIKQADADVAAFEASQAGKSDEDDGRKRRAKRTQVVAAGWVIGVAIKQGKRAHLVLDDHTARVEVSMFWDDYMQYQEYFQAEQVLIVEGGIGYDDFANAYAISARRIYNIDEARGDQVGHVQLSWDHRQFDEESLEKARAIPENLQQALQPHKGGSCPVVINYRSTLASARVKLGNEWRVTANEELLQKLRRQWGSEAVKLVYRRH